MTSHKIRQSRDCSVAESITMAWYSKMLIVMFSDDPDRKYDLNYMPAVMTMSMFRWAT